MKRGYASLRRNSLREIALSKRNADQGIRAPTPKVFYCRHLLKKGKRASALTKTFLQLSP